MKRENDLTIPERNEFHDWYLKKYGREHPLGYSEIYRKLTGKDGQQEEEKVRAVVDEFEKESEYIRNLIDRWNSIPNVSFINFKKE